MSRPAIDAVFDAMFALTDIRVMLRETAPGHALSEAQRERALALLNRIDENVTTLRRELLP